MALVGDFCQGGGASTRGRTSTSDNEQRLNGMLHVIIPHPEKKHKVAQTLERAVLLGLILEQAVLRAQAQKRAVFLG